MNETIDKDEDAVENILYTLFYILISLTRYVKILNNLYKLFFC